MSGAPLPRRIETYSKRSKNWDLTQELHWYQAVEGLEHGDLKPLAAYLEQKGGIIDQSVAARLVDCLRQDGASSFQLIFKKRIKEGNAKKPSIEILERKSDIRRWTFEYWDRRQTKETQKSIFESLAEGEAVDPRTIREAIQASLKDEKLRDLWDRRNRALNAVKKRKS